MKYRNRSGFIRRKRVSDTICQRNLQHGQGMTEYIIIVALIALASIAGVKYFGNAVQGSFAGMTAVLGGGTPDTGIATATTAAGNSQTEADRNKTLGNYYNPGE